MNVAVVGLGGRGLAHVRTLTSLGMPPVGAVDHHEDRRAAAAGAGARSTWAHLEELLAGSTPDLTIVATPPADHVATALVALAAGSAVLIEKPVAVEPDDVASLLPHAARVGVAHSERWNPAAAAIRDLLATGAVGDVQRATFERRGPAPHGAGVGVDADLAVHDLDLARWLLGPFTVREREASPGARPDRVRIGASASNIDIEVRAAWAPDVVRLLRIEGSRGAAVAELHGVHAWFEDRSGRRRPLATGAARPLEGLLGAVLAAMAAGGPLPVPLDDAVLALAAAIGRDHRPDDRRSLV